VIALRREETGVLVMELSEHFWPEDIESAIPVVHDIARSPQNPLLLLVVVDRDFDMPLWDFLGQILQPGLLAQNRPSRVAMLTPNPAEPKNKLNSEVQMRFFGPNQECEARARLLSFATPHCLPPISWVNPKQANHNNDRKIGIAAVKTLGSAGRGFVPLTVRDRP
jgi:hypothetical protein